MSGVTIYSFFILKIEIRLRGKLRKFIYQERCEINIYLLLLQVFARVGREAPQ
jgi:hypothetical protein